VRYRGLTPGDRSRNRTDRASTNAEGYAGGRFGRTITSVSKVVERGLTRCPRCVTTADYVFIEADSNVTRYEVRCRSCGEFYGENWVSWALPVARDDEPPLRWPPDCEPGAVRDWRFELRNWLNGSASQGRQAAEAIGLHAQALAGFARIELAERLRGVRNGHTGG
jgi:hypothetical protein